jgi:nucleotide-binding universal stress UspA family protein
MKILLAVDGSEYSKKMLAYLVTHEDLFTKGQEYHVFTAHPLLPARARSIVGKDIVDTYYAEESEAIISPVTQFLLRHGINASSSWGVGSASELIAQLAHDNKFNLIVLGSHGHTALGNLVMGSVATQVLAHSKVPVLIIR